MRTRLLTAAFVALYSFAPAAVFAAAPAKGQRAREATPPPPKPAEAAEDSEEGSSDSSGGETEGNDVRDDRRPEGDHVKLAPGAKDAVSGEVHTVVKGDTLWDLSQHYLGSPWYWPKVWSYNPEIANPHWIYPGNQVRFNKAGEEAPAQVEVGNDQSDAPGQNDDSGAGGEMASDQSDSVQVIGKIGYTPISGFKVAQLGFVTTREVQEAGVIDSSFGEQNMLVAPQTVYIEFKDKSAIKVGDQYLVFRTASEVMHPVTGTRYGYLTRLVAAAKVIKVSPKLATAVLTKSWDGAERGDRVGPAGENFTRALSERPNDREVKGGLVIGVMDPSLALYGEHQMIILDRGTSDGVQPGNTFTVIRQNDRGGEFAKPQAWDERYPVEDLATCQAVEVKDKASTCLLTRSIREVVSGDRVEMRPSSGSAPRASLR